jgi:hypothetical protein
MSGDHQSIVVGTNALTQIDLTSANRTICVRCAKRLADYFDFFYEFRRLDYGKCARYLILGQVCEPVNSFYIFKFNYD